MFRRKSPNLQKRHLVKKDTTPPSSAIAGRLEQQQSSSAPVGEENPGLPPPPSTAPSHLKSPREPARHKLRKPKTAETNDEASTLESTKLSLKLPLSRDALGSDGLLASPKSSAREALEIYRPRQTTETSTVKPLSSHRHPRRHPHHIQNSIVATETSYSRDSPRADAIAEAQKTVKSRPAKDSSTLLLPLASSVPPPPTLAAATSPKIKARSPAHSPTHKRVKSPVKTRSGYCQLCVYEGRSCKINDCLKHQFIK